MSIEYYNAKSILSKLKDAPDSYFGITYNMNLYRGCQHACIYCDSRSTVYGLGDLATIRIKQNALILLEQNLKKRIKKATIGTGSMNDPYMPVELREKLTRSALEIIARYKYPIHVLTKSNLVTRDLDILQEISKTFSAVSFTITTLSDSIAGKIEPFASSSSERLGAMKDTHLNNIYTGALIMPVLPYITDNKEDIELLIKNCADNGAQYILFAPGMTLRDGQREYFYSALEKRWPGLAKKYQRRFKNQYSCSTENYKQLWDTFNNTCEKLGVKTKMNFFKENIAVQKKLF